MLKTQYKNIFTYQDSLWWYKGMQAINERLLAQHLPKQKKLKILDAGCGPGAALMYLAKFGDVIGVDVSDEALKFAKKRGKVRKGDIANLPFKDETFDVVTCLDVLYHKWVDTDKAFSEIKRVLKKGGILLIREPAFDWFKSSEDVDLKQNIDLQKENCKKHLVKTLKFLNLHMSIFYFFP